MANENLAMKMTAAFLDSKGVRYQVLDEKAMRIGFSADNKDTVEVIVVFDDDNTSVGLRSFKYCKFDDEKREEMYKLCSQKNFRYRWVKFYVDEQDNTITIADDAVIQLDSCGEEVFELVYRMVGIADDCYRDFMRAIYA